MAKSSYGRRAGWAQGRNRRPSRGGPPGDLGSGKAFFVEWLGLRGPEDFWCRFSGFSVGSLTCSAPVTFSGPWAQLPLNLGELTLRHQKCKKYHCQKLEMHFNPSGRDNTTQMARIAPPRARYNTTPSHA